MGNYSHAHICQCLTLLATARRDSPLTICGDRRKTGKQFVDGVMGLAHGLIQLGLRPGVVVAISAFNSDEYLEWLLAIAFVGGIAAPLNYRWSLEEAKSAIEIVTPALLVTDNSCEDWCSKFQVDSMTFLKWHVVMDDSINSKCTGNILTTELLRKHSLLSTSLTYRWAPNDAALICFTSGTTGRLKGVTINHLSLIVQSLAKIAIVGYSENDIYLHTAPLCHIGGISSAIAMLMVGGLHVLIPKFEAESALVTIQQQKVTSLITVPTMLADLLSLIRSKEKWKELETVKKILNGGGEISIDITKDAIKTFPRARLLSAYGMTEACSSLTFKTLYNPLSNSSGDVSSQVVGYEQCNIGYQPGGICVGKPAPHIEIKINSESFSKVGKILTRGPNVMLGYWGQISAKDSHEDWLDTGDIGWIDDHGNVWLVGRTNGRIKSGGENVYPEEVEAVLSTHLGLSGIVVVGVPDARLTEMVVACIQLKDNWQWVHSSAHNSAKCKEQIISTKILQHFCRQKMLTGFKVPRAFIIWRRPFPFTTTGKLRRDHVRREVMFHMKLLPSCI